MKIAQQLAARTKFRAQRKAFVSTTGVGPNARYSPLPAPRDESLSYFQRPWRSSGSLGIRVVNGPVMCPISLRSTLHYSCSYTRIPKERLGRVSRIQDLYRLCFHMRYYCYDVIGICDCRARLQGSFGGSDSSRGDCIRMRLTPVNTIG